MRLIDADAFIQMMEEKCDPESTLDPWVLSVCRGGVKMMPTVDAVPVVRCKDCEWWTKQDKSLQGRCARYGTYPTGEWFCAAGRMDGKGNSNETD